MSPAPSEHPDDRAGESNMSSTYILVVAVEVLVILSLYWLGRQFG